MNPKDEEKRLFVRYYNGQSTENEFLNTSTIELGAQDKKSQFSRLRNRLNWDEANNVSVIMEEKSVEEEMIGIWIKYYALYLKQIYYILEFSYYIFLRAYPLSFIYGYRESTG